MALMETVTLMLSLFALIPFSGARLQKLLGAADSAHPGNLGPSGSGLEQKHRCGRRCPVLKEGK